MRKIALLAVSVIALIGFEYMAHAQTISGTVTTRWVLPTTTQDGLPLTGANAITSVQVFVWDTSIPDAPASQPTVTLGAGATTTVQTIPVANGSTIFVRLRACNASGCSALSAQVSKPVQIDVKPGVPTSVTVEIKIG